MTTVIRTENSYNIFSPYNESAPRLFAADRKEEDHMTLFGYIRVSTQDQNDSRQRDALAPCNILAQNLYTDRTSGKDFDRPGYKHLMCRLRPGDLLIVTSIDRLGRNYADIIEQWRLITNHIGADIRVLDMPALDTTFCKDLLGSFISDLVLQVMSFAAQVERDHMLRRQAEGFAAAKARGVRLGKEPLPLPKDFDVIYRRWRSGELSASEAASQCNMSKRTLYEKTQNRRIAERKKPEHPANFVPLTSKAV
ncbi:MAG: recombinase family protein [Coriobacteriales bacterium]|jgi:DNA invertase Pin-like site-specific DNA recombinase|nr:recombinase family protein [Coriobacteriales bacterium]